MDDINDINHLPNMKLDDPFAYFLSYIVWDSKFPRDGSYVSLVHKGWAYPIKGEIFDNFEIKYFQYSESPIKQHIPPYDDTDDDTDNDTDNNNTNENFIQGFSEDMGSRFYYYKISLSMLPDNLIINKNEREPCGFGYHPFANEKNIIIFKAFGEDE
jgi:hypothetical protein